ncbi:MAG: peptidyl-prolyl cis-trans isomerase [Alphaproteobacteria bacterium]|nr:peptidyl-prolyl cis-trans isomerase [Alphaproteobacteria bacterium]
MRNKFTAIAVIALILAKPMDVTAAEGKDGVAAVVNGKKITVSEIKKGYDENQQIKSQMKFDDFYPKALNVFVNSDLVLQAANVAKIKDTATYKDQIKALEDELARRVFLERAVSKAVTDAEVKKLYEQYKKEFKQEKEVKARHILVDDESKAKDIIAKLNKGEKFEDLAKANSKDSQSDLGYFNKNMMVKEFSDAVFAMKKGDRTKAPIKTQFGYHIVEVQDIRESKPLSFKEAEPQIKAMLTQKSIADVIGGLRKDGKITEYALDGKEIDTSTLPQ